MKSMEYFLVVGDVVVTVVYLSSENSGEILGNFKCSHVSQKAGPLS
jgi:hypothetical protein